MRRRSGSIFLTLFVCAVIIICITVSLDLAGIIKLPERFSLKKYLSKSVGTLGAGQEVYYPDYQATGLNAENKITEDTTKIPVVQTEETKNEIDYDEINKILNKENEIVEPTYNVTDNSFFYTQLDDYGKTFYSRLYSNLDNLKTGTYSIDFGTTFNDLLHTENGEKVLKDAFQLSINAMLLDHPEIFYLDVTKMYMFTESTTTFMGTTYKISIGPDGENSYLLEGFNSQQDVFMAETNIQKELDKIDSLLYGSTAEKVLQVHNYLIDNIVYDTSNDEISSSHTIYGALVNKLAVCDGYAKAFKYILDRVGISCVEVCGMAQNSTGNTESHAWNDVLVDGKWYAVDVTWDDPIIIGGSGILTNDLRYSYFLRGSDTFYSSHQEDGYIVVNGEFSYPEISGNSYY